MRTISYYLLPRLRGAEWRGLEQRMHYHKEKNGWQNEKMYHKRGAKLKTRLEISKRLERTRIKGKMRKCITKRGAKLRAF